MAALQAEAYRALLASLLAPLAGSRPPFLSQVRSVRAKRAFLPHVPTTQVLSGTRRGFANDPPHHAQGMLGTGLQSLCLPWRPAQAVTLFAQGCVSRAAAVAQVSQEATASLEALLHPRATPITGVRQAYAGARGDLCDCASPAASRS